MMKVHIHPGICGLSSTVSAVADEELETVHVECQSMCEAVTAMFSDLGHDFDIFSVCLQRPGRDPFTQYAAAHFPAHASCPTLAGIMKCIEVEGELALPKDALITFMAGKHRHENESHSE